MRWRLFPDIRYGTERYPDKLARRLRVVNITTWLAAAVTVFYAAFGLVEPSPGRWQLVAVDSVVALGFALVPLLHRFGPLAGPLAFIGLAYGFLFVNSALVGTGGGAYLYYLTATALGILFLGPSVTLSRPPSASSPPG